MSCDNAIRQATHSTYISVSLVVENTTDMKTTRLIKLEMCL